jgi:hypothetical protein
MVWQPLAYLSRQSVICQGTLGKKPNHSKICQIWRTSFYIDGCASLRTVAFKRPIFKQKKGYANISLGLNSCSMGSYQPPSRSSVPLNLIQDEQYILNKLYINWYSCLTTFFYSNDLRFLFT